MVELMNTVDIIGDEALTNSIIDRSITEFVDANLKSVGAYAFKRCKSLTKVILAKVTTISNNAFYEDNQLNVLELPMVFNIGDSAFYSCTALTEINLTIGTENIILRGSAFGMCTGLTKVKVLAENIDRYFTISSDAFYYCSNLNTVDCFLASIFRDSFIGCGSLKALILRSGKRISDLNNTSAFKNTPIASGTGYIYVPRALVDSYKAETNWSTYANQFRALEDYTVDGTTTGELDIPLTWEDVLGFIADGTYKDNLAIGDTVPLDLGDEGVVNMEIVAFDADDKADGSGKAAITWIAKNLLTTTRSMRSNPYGGEKWDQTPLRSWLQGDFYNSVPVDVKNAIVPVTKTYYDLSTTQSCTDTVWVPSYWEIFGTASSYPCETFGAEYTSVFNTDTSRQRGNYWWLRSLYNEYGTFGAINLKGEQAYNSASPIGVVIGFCT